jgi:hypothetical protein
VLNLGLGLRSALAIAWCRLLYALWPVARRLSHRPAAPNVRFSIAIATFKDRFDDLFMPLLKNVAFQFHDTQVIVFANGHVDQEKQAEYLPRIQALCRAYPNVELHTSMLPRSLSSIWNLMIRQSRANKVLVLNDDVRITPRFRSNMLQTGIFDTDVCLINNIWSHFLISKSVVERIGGFDEALAELGGEDDDYNYRLSVSGIPLENRHTAHIRNESRPSRRNSFGHDMTRGHRYSERNAERLAAKWIIAPEPFPGSTYVQRMGVYVARRGS